MNKSSTLGIGYLSSFEAGLTVCLKSPQTQTLLSGLTTDTIGDAHSDVCTDSSVPSAANDSTPLQLLASPNKGYF